MRRRWWLASVIAACVACGSSSTPTSTPTTPATPTVVQLAGIWTMTLTTTAATGGECLDGALQPTVGTSTPVTMTFTQTGTSLSATSTAQTNGISCFWSGTADVDRFNLNLSSCQSTINQIGLHCSNGAVRDLKIASAGINGTINVNGQYMGTKADTYNVFVSGTTTIVGQLVVNQNVLLSK